VLTSPSRTGRTLIVFPFPKDVQAEAFDDCPNFLARAGLACRAVRARAAELAAVESISRFRLPLVVAMERADHTPMRRTRCARSATQPHPFG